MNVYGTVANSMDGTTVVGRYSDASGNTVGFEFNTTPEPGSTALIVGLTSVGASVLRKRRRK